VEREYEILQRQEEDLMREERGEVVVEGHGVEEGKAEVSVVEDTDQEMGEGEGRFYD
jgi:hypothetical protein